MSDFTPLNGGIGISLACITASSTRAVLPVAPDGVVANAVRVNNIGVNYAFVALGKSTIDGTTACTAIAPGASPNIEFQFAGGSGAPTHIGGISIGGNTTLQITLGILS